MERDEKLRKEKAKKAFIIALGVSAVGGVAYLTWDHLRKKKLIQQQLPENASDTIINITNALPATTSTTKSTSAGDSFPLKKGSKGSRVVQLQQALARILGDSVMNANGGIDGIFGSGTANALRLAGYGEVIDENTFTKIINQKSEAIQLSFNPLEIANSLYRNAQAIDVNGTLAVLKQIGSSDQYSQVNEYYKKIPLLHSRTIVTDLLDYAFKYNETAKQQIRNEFLRMGLKLSSSGTWSLSGLNDIITLRETVVTDGYQNKIPVRRDTILGDEIKVANGMTWFRSVDNSILQVPTQDVKYTN